MPFGNKAGPTIVFKYYARRPVEGLDAVQNQLRLGHRYRNCLVELELERRRRYAEITDSLTTPAIAAAEEIIAERNQQIDALVSEISKRNAAARRRTGTEAERVQLKLWRANRKMYRQAVKEMRADLKPQAKAQYDELHTWFTIEQKVRRHASGLYWSNYLEIERSVNSSGPPPRFHKATGEGKVAMQIQKGMSPDEAYVCTDLRFRIKRPPPSAYITPPTSKSRRKCRTVARLRVDSDEEGSPIWAKIPVLMHRLPPNDAVIKWIYLVRRRARGTQERWQLQLVLERAKGWTPADCATEGAVGVDLGWRTFDDRLRVAYWAGSDGESGELSLPTDLIDRWTYAESIQSIRAKRFETARNLMADWLHDHAEDDNDDQMNWIRQNTPELSRWRSSARLASFVRRWADLGGEPPVLTVLQEWRKQEMHLLRLESSMREGAAEARNEIYRRFAAQMRRRYAMIKVEAWNIRRSIQAPAPDEQSSNAAARVYHRIAAVGLLRQYLIAKARHVLKVDPAYSTKRCHVCGTIDDWDAGEHLLHKCLNCGKRWDQDENAAKNILWTVSDEKQIAVGS